MNYLSDGNTRGTWPSSPDQFFSLLRSFLPPYHRMKEPSVRFYLPDYTIPRAGTKLWRRIIYQILLSHESPFTGTDGGTFHGELNKLPSPISASRFEERTFLPRASPCRFPCATGWISVPLIEIYPVESKSKQVVGNLSIREGGKGKRREEKEEKISKSQKLKSKEKIARQKAQRDRTW